MASDWPPAHALGLAKPKVSDLAGLIMCLLNGNCICRYKALHCLTRLVCFWLCFSSSQKNVFSGNIGSVLIGVHA
jgi:hypothetical protein